MHAPARACATSLHTQRHASSNCRYAHVRTQGCCMLSMTVQVAWPLQIGGKERPRPGGHIMPLFSRAGSAKARFKNFQIQYHTRWAGRVQKAHKLSDVRNQLPVCMPAHTWLVYCCSLSPCMRACSSFSMRYSIFLYPIGPFSARGRSKSMSLGEALHGCVGRRTASGTGCCSQAKLMPKASQQYS